MTITAAFFLNKMVGGGVSPAAMRRYLTAAAAALVLLTGVVVGVQSQTLSVGDFSWTHIGLYPFSNSAVHVLKYGDEILCSRLLDNTEEPWVRANGNRTLSVSYGRVGSQTTLHYSVDAKDYVTLDTTGSEGNDMNFTTLALGVDDSFFGQQVRAFNRRVAHWGAE